jgi:hypothetical protein
MCGPADAAEWAAADLYFVGILVGGNGLAKAKFFLSTKSARARARISSCQSNVIGTSLGSDLHNQ